MNEAIVGAAIGGFTMTGLIPLLIVGGRKSTPNRRAFGSIISVVAAIAGMYGAGEIGLEHIGHVLGSVCTVSWALLNKARTAPM